MAAPSCTSMRFCVHVGTPLTSFVDLFLFVFFFDTLHSMGIACWERADPLALLFVTFSCALSFFHKVSWDMCGT